MIQNQIIQFLLMRKIIIKIKNIKKDQFHHIIINLHQDHFPDQFQDQFQDRHRDHHRDHHQDRLVDQEVDQIIDHIVNQIKKN